MDNTACLACGNFPSVGVKLLTCQGCKRAKYCSLACQKHDWKRGGHKTECGKLLAAAEVAVSPSEQPTAAASGSVAGSVDPAALLELHDALSSDGDVASAYSKEGVLVFDSDRFDAEAHETSVAHLKVEQVAAALVDLEAAAEAETRAQAAYDAGVAQAQEARAEAQQEQQALAATPPRESEYSDSESSSEASDAKASYLTCDGILSKLLDTGATFESLDEISRQTLDAALRIMSSATDVQSAVHLVTLFSRSKGAWPPVDLVDTSLEKFAGVDKSGDVQFVLGVAIILKSVNPENAALGFKWVDRAARKDHQEASSIVGDMLAEGLGTSKNVGRAIEWWEMAAKKGSASAMLTLGQVYHRGDHGRPTDAKKARLYLNKVLRTAKEGSAESGSIFAEAQEMLSLMGPVEECCDLCGKSGASVKLSACTTCQKSKYCSKACQREDWNKGHKQECAVLALDAALDAFNSSSRDIMKKVGDSRSRSPQLSDLGSTDRDVIQSRFAKLEVAAKASRVEDGRAQFRVALCYLHGDWVAHDVEKAVGLLEEELNHRNSEALRHLEEAANDHGSARAAAILYKWHHGKDQGSESVELKWLRRAGDLGDPTAQGVLGFYHYKGEHGFEEDKDQGTQWWRNAAEQEDVYSMRMLGLLDAAELCKNQNKENFDSAVHWLSRGRDAAVKSGNDKGAAECEKELSEVARSTINHFRCIFRERGSSWGSVPAAGLHLVELSLTALNTTCVAKDDKTLSLLVQLCLSERFESTTMGEEQICDYLEKGSELGSATAASHLWNLARKRGKPEGACLKLCEKAAELGNSNAQHDFGIAYYKGEFIEQNHELSVLWLQKAAEKDNAGAQYKMGLIYSGRTDIEIELDMERAMRWSERAAEQDHLPACLDAAKCYEQGFNVTKDTSRAIKLFEKSYSLAVAKGDNDVVKDCQEALDRLQPPSFIDTHALITKAAEFAGPATLPELNDALNDGNVAGAYSMEGKLVVDSDQLDEKVREATTANANAAQLKVEQVAAVTDLEKQLATEDETGAQIIRVQAAQEAGDTQAAEVRATRAETEQVRQEQQAPATPHRDSSDSESSFSEAIDAEALYLTCNGILSKLEDSGATFESLDEISRQTLDAALRIMSSATDKCSAFNLGDLFVRSNGVWPSVVLVVSNLEKFFNADTSGDVQFLLGEVIMADNQENAALAFEYFKESARKNHQQAELQVGDMFAEGLGTSKNVGRAIEWWEMAAKKGSASAMLTLGQVYHRGDHGRPTDSKKTRSYLNNVLRTAKEGSEKTGSIFAEAQEMLSLMGPVEECCDLCGKSGASVKLSACTTCQKSKYCSKACQREDWKKGHKQECAVFALDAALDAFNSSSRGMMKKFGDPRSRSPQLSDLDSTNRDVIQSRFAKLEVAAKASRVEDGRAQFRVALCYLRGDWVAQNVEKAVGLLEEELNHQNSEALKYLEEAANDRGSARAAAILYKRHDDKDQGSESVELKWLRRAGALGDPTAQGMLGFYHYKGEHGFEEDKDQGIQWWRNAAEQEDVYSMRMLGFLDAQELCKNQNIENFDSAVHWLSRGRDAAVKSGNDKGAAECEKELSGVARSTINHFRCIFRERGSSWGSVPAAGLHLVELSLTALNTTRVAKDDETLSLLVQLCLKERFGSTTMGEEQIYDYLEKGSELGSAIAASHLWNLARRRGKPEGACLKLCEKAAELGDSNAQHAFGIAYYKGEFIEQNHELSVQWLQKAAEKDNAGAQYKMGLIYSGRTDIEIELDMERAMRWSERAAEQDHLPACLDAAKCYEQGFNVTKDTSRAIKLFEKSYSLAVAKGDNDVAKDCQEALDRLQPPSLIDTHALITKAAEFAGPATLPELNDALNDGNVAGAYSMDGVDNGKLVVDSDQLDEKVREATAANANAAQLKVKQVAAVTDLEKQLATEDETGAQIIRVQAAQEVGDTQAAEVRAAHAETEQVRQEQQAPATPHRDSSDSESSFSEASDAEALYLTCDGILSKLEDSGATFESLDEISRQTLDAALRIMSSATDKCSALNLGDLFIRSNGVWPPVDLVVSNLEKFVNADTSGGVQFLLGEVIMEDDQENAALAFEYFKESARKDHQEASSIVGGMLARGLGTSKNVGRAIEWWEMAAKKGSASAMLTLGQVYHRGDHGRPTDSKKARSYLNKVLRTAKEGSAESGSIFAEAQEMLSLMGPVEECCDLCGKSEASVKLSACTTCQKSKYCSKACQREDWKKGHKQECAVFALDAALDAFNSSSRGMMKKFGDPRSRSPQLSDLDSTDRDVIQSRFAKLEVAAKASRVEDGRAQFRVALCYLRGDWVAQNVEKAVGLLEEELNHQNSEALKYLEEAANDRGSARAAAILYKRHDDKDQGFESVELKWLRRAGDLGDPTAQGILGFYRYNGEHGFEEDKDQGIQWWRNAAEQEDVYSMSMLGLLDAEELCKNQNKESFDSAVHWLSRGRDAAVKSGNDEGAAECEKELSEVARTTINHFRCIFRERGSSWGSVPAAGLHLVELSLTALNTTCVAKDDETLSLLVELCLKERFESTTMGEEQIYDYLERGSELGSAIAASHLWNLARRRGDPEDACLKLCEKAAELGDSNAQHAFGIAYYKGEFVEQNHELSVKWWLKAAEKGDAGAQYNMGLIYSGRTDIEIVLDMEKAIESFEKAYSLAVTNGNIHVAKNCQKALDSLQPISRVDTHGLVDREAQSELAEDDDAVRRCEEVLSRLQKESEIEPPSHVNYFSDGALVEVVGTSKSTVNGKKGRIMSFVTSTGRFVVRSENGEGEWKLKPESLKAWSSVVALELAEDERGDVVDSDSDPEVVEEIVDGALDSTVDSTVDGGQIDTKEVGDQPAPQEAEGAPEIPGNLQKKKPIPRAEKLFQQASKMLKELQDFVDAGISKWSSMSVKATKMVKIYEEAANLGHVDAMIDLGFLYKDGDAVKRNIEKVLAWWLKASEKGDALALIELHKLYSHGNFVKKNEAKAEEFLKAAAESGDPESQFLFGEWFLDDNKSSGEKMSPEADAFSSKEEAMKWYKASAENGYAPAQRELGALFDKREEVHEKLFWYEKAAEQGDHHCAYVIAWTHDHGHGVPKDLAMAAKWFIKSAELGDIEGQCNAGRCYRLGHGVEADGAQALKWYKLAAKNGSAGAMLSIGDIYYMGVLVERNTLMAKLWLKKAAEKDETAAQLALGRCYVKDGGFGFCDEEVDLAQAAYYLELASRSVKSEDAKHAECAQKLLGVVRQRIEEGLCSSTSFEGGFEATAGTVEDSVPTGSPIDSSNVLSGEWELGDARKTKSDKKKKGSKANKKKKKKPPREKKNFESTTPNLISKSVPEEDSSDSSSESSEDESEDEDAPPPVHRLFTGVAKGRVEKSAEDKSRGPLNPPSSPPRRPSVLPSSSRSSGAEAAAEPPPSLLPRSPTLPRGPTSPGSPLRRPPQARRSAGGSSSSREIAEEATFQALMRQSVAEEAARVCEDEGAAALVARVCAGLHAGGATAAGGSGAAHTFGGTSSPAHDGDCLVRCAVEHDFGGGGMTADELRLAVVARVRARALAALVERRAEVDRLCAALDAAAARASPAEVAEAARLHAETARLVGPVPAAEIEARCAQMARPGTVMGEDELQALADVRGACVQVRSLICVRESSDFGAELPPKTYRPSAEVLAAGGGGGGGGGLGAPVGRGDTLMLLQEMRAHRMSHYQLLRLPTPSPPPGLASTAALEAEAEEID